MTVASIDTKTGDTVLFSLPRNLQHFPVIPRLRSRWPDGFTGVAPGDEGLLNELFQDAEDDPSLVPGFDKGRRGPELVREEISYLIGQPIDYYVLVNLFGFADIVDAIGGVKVHIAQDIPYGGPEDGARRPGCSRPATGSWTASRRCGSDARAREQRLRPNGPAEVPDEGRSPNRPTRSGADEVPAARHRREEDDLHEHPGRVLPALVKLSGTMKHGAQVNEPDVRAAAVPRRPAERRGDAAGGGRRRSPPARARDSRPSPGVSADPGASADPSASAVRQTQLGKP